MIFYGYPANVHTFIYTSTHTNTHSLVDFIPTSLTVNIILYAVTLPQEQFTTLLVVSNHYFTALHTSSMNLIALCLAIIYF